MRTAERVLKPLQQRCSANAFFVKQGQQSSGSYRYRTALQLVSASKKRLRCWESALMHQLEVARQEKAAAPHLRFDTASNRKTPRVLKLRGGFGILRPFAILRVWFWPIALKKGSRSSANKLLDLAR